MIKQCISAGWQVSAPGTNGFIPVNLPHDYCITQPRDPRCPGGGQNAYYPGGDARYVKYAAVPPVRSERDTHRLLDVDGAYMLASVKLNDNLLAMHPHGYTPFLVDLTPKLNRGHTNKLEIDTSCPQPNTRWYSGAGVYRDVFLWTGGDVRVEPWDVTVNTVSANEAEAVLSVTVLVTADAQADAAVAVRLPGIAEAEKTLSVCPEQKTAFDFTLTIPSPRLWDVDDPQLYTLETEIRAGSVLTDTAETRFGIRTISADPENGFRLNGRPMKLRGGCIHHDHGVLGAAAWPDAERRKVSRLKAAGFNALRIAHNPPSLALLEACDEIGMLVMDEAFDMWNLPKNPLDYHLWFADWYERDLSYMIGRDHTHPCVIAYSIGNEISEAAGISDGPAWSEKLAAVVKRLDPTRFCTVCTWGVELRPEAHDPEDYKADFLAAHTQFADNGWDVSWTQRTAPYYAPHDIAGYNYLFDRYKADRTRFPDRVIWGSETHTLRFYDSWHTILECPHVLGDFTWVAWDNLGEAGAGRSLWARDGYIPYIDIAPYPWRSCFQGDFDMCGYRLPRSWFREAVWLGRTQPRIFTTHPEHHGEGFSGTGWHWYDVHETWTFPDEYIGHPVTCEVYTDTDEIRWALNGQPCGVSVPEKCIARIDVPYAPGVLTAEAVKDGQSVGTYSLRTTGPASAVSVTPEITSFRADGRSLCWFDVTVTDENGLCVTEARTSLSCSVTGGRLLGFFSGDPKNEDVYGSPVCHAFEGRALAIIQSDTPGPVTLTVSADGLLSGSAVVVAE